MNDTANQNPRFTYAPFIDRWAVYDRRQNSGESVLCLTLSEEKAKHITELLNRSTVTVNNTLKLALEKLNALYSKHAKDCEPEDCAQWDDAITACTDELEGMIIERWRRKCLK